MKSSKVRRNLPLEVLARGAVGDFLGDGWSFAKTFLKLVQLLLHLGSRQIEGGYVIVVSESKVCWLAVRE